MTAENTIVVVSGTDIGFTGSHTVSFVIPLVHVQSGTYVPLAGTVQGELYTSGQAP